MQHHEFLGQVQARAHLDDIGKATTATRATLQTLGERIPEGLADNVAAELPQEIGEYLRQTIIMAGAGTGERFDRDEFIARVCERSHLDPPHATYAARVVLEVLGEATQGRLMERVRESLPEDVRELAMAGSSGKM